MIWLKLAIPFAMASAGALLLMHYTGEMADMSERAGIQEQALVQKDQAIAQERALRSEEEAERLKAEAEHRKALEALSQRDRAHQESVERANELLAENRRLAHENEEMAVWVMQHHPTDVRVQLNAARSRAGANSGHQGGNPEPAGITD